MSGTPEFCFGISSWSYPWAIGVASGPQPKEKMTTLGLIQKADSLGVKLVQIADNLPLEKLSKSELAELKSEALNRNIKIEVGTKGIGKDHLLHFLELAQFLDSPIVRTLPAIFGVRVSIEEVEESLRSVLPEFEKAGVKIVLENQEAYKVTEYSQLMTNINNPSLRICLDLANSLGAMEGPEYVLSELAHFTGNFHFKDVEIIRSKTLMGFSVVGTPSGKGKIPIYYVLEKLKELNLYPSVILELWPDWQGDIDSTLLLEEKMVEESVCFMKTLHW